LGLGKVTVEEISVISSARFYALHGVRSYSYYIEGSLDEKDWIRLVDHTRYLCRSWQNLRFPARVVRWTLLSTLYSCLLLFWN